MEDFYHASSETDNAKEQWGGGDQILLQKFNCF